MFAVKKHGKYNIWETIALYDIDWHYRGTADVFENRSEAQDYLKFYDRKVNDHRHREKQKLKVFDEAPV
jgi:ABC-type Fe3+-hydroxamate transport system substrate-binding protein